LNFYGTDFIEPSGGGPIIGKDLITDHPERKREREREKRVQKTNDKDRVFFSKIKYSFSRRTIFDSVGKTQTQV
jgi:CRISPR/Cas system-associated protein Cas5 (RAMP superfamily)